jgi:hypothetical protein
MFAVSKGDRPPRPKNPDCLLGPTDDVWSLIQDCWGQEPGARPEMKSVHRRLQSVIVGSMPLIPSIGTTSGDFGLGFRRVGRRHSIDVSLARLAAHPYAHAARATNHTILGSRASIALDAGALSSTAIAGTAADAAAELPRPLLGYFASHAQPRLTDHAPPTLIAQSVPGPEKRKYELWARPPLPGLPPSPAYGLTYALSPVAAAQVAALAHDAVSVDDLHAHNSLFTPDTHTLPPPAEEPASGIPVCSSQHASVRDDDAWLAWAAADASQLTLSPSPIIPAQHDADSHYYLPDLRGSPLLVDKSSSAMLVGRYQLERNSFGDEYLG